MEPVVRRKTSTRSKSADSRCDLLVDGVKEGKVGVRDGAQ